jgi:hypothetical protein
MVMASIYDQTTFDDMVDTLIGHEIRITKHAADMHKQDDPIAPEREDEVMMMQNIIYSLRDYDVTSELLTDDEIRTNYEMGLQIAINWPR